ncbi:hypothetical protein [Xylella fastidiosa]|uniref:hypothetical protein n=1 Tax=Xylella fastidiosa TaxID=2371 RepID=UPI0039847908
MAHNQIAGGNQLVIGNGTSGYVYNTYTELLAEQITGEGFPGLKACDYVDSYIVGVETQQVLVSFRPGDATQLKGLDRYEAKASPDRIVGFTVIHRIVLCGQALRNSSTTAAHRKVLFNAMQALKCKQAAPPSTPSNRWAIRFSGWDMMAVCIG